MHMCVKEMYMDVYPSKPINVVDGGEKKKNNLLSAEADDCGSLLTEMFIYCH